MLVKLTQIDGGGISTTSNINAANLSVTGNIGAAGTLTYEDVTSVDSIGVITARSGLDVDDFLSVGNNIHLGSAGVITATSFIGDGSTLSGVASTEFIHAESLEVVGLSTFNNLNVTGVSTFTDKVHITGVGTFSSQVNYFGPKVSGTNDHGISLLYNGTAGVFTFHDQSGDGFIRSYSELFFLVDADQSTGWIGGGYGLRMTTGFTDTPPGSLIPYTISQGLPNLGRDAHRYGTIFSEQFNASGISTFSSTIKLNADGSTSSNYISVGANDDLKIYHDSNNSYINGTGTGELYLVGSCVNLQHGGGLSTLYTEPSGIAVNGNVDASGILSGGDGIRLPLIGGVGITTIEKGQASFTGIVTAATFKGNGDFVDIDVDGHTNLDNLSVAGVSTFSGNVGFAASTSTPTNVNMNVGSNDEIQIRYNGNIGTIDMYDYNAFCMAIRSAYTLILRANFGTNTAALGDGYGLDITDVRVSPATSNYDLGSSLSPFGSFFSKSATFGPGVLEENYFNDTGGGIQSNHTHDVVTYGMVWYGVTNAAGAWTFNIRGDASTTFDSLTNNNKVTTMTIYSANNNTANYMTAFKIDGTTQTVKWAGGSAPSAATGSGVDVYSMTIMKTAANTYHVFGNLTNFA